MGNVIFYGYIILYATVSSLIQIFFDIPLLVYWSIVILAIAYYISLPYIQHLAYGKDH